MRGEKEHDGPWQLERRVPENDPCRGADTQRFGVQLPGTRARVSNFDLDVTESLTGAERADLRHQPRPVE